MKKFIAETISILLFIVVQLCFIKTGKTNLLEAILYWFSAYAPMSAYVAYLEYKRNQK